MDARVANKSLSADGVKNIRSLLRKRITLDELINAWNADRSVRPHATLTSCAIFSKLLIRLLKDDISEKNLKTLKSIIKSQISPSIQYCQKLLTPRQASIFLGLASTQQMHDAFTEQEKIFFTYVRDKSKKDLQVRNANNETTTAQQEDMSKIIISESRSKFENQYFSRKSTTNRFATLRTNLSMEKLRDKDFTPEELRLKWLKDLNVWGVEMIEKITLLAELTSQLIDRGEKNLHQIKKIIRNWIPYFIESMPLLIYPENLNTIADLAFHEKMDKIFTKGQRRTLLHLKSIHNHQ